MPKPIVLFVPHSEASFSEMLYIADKIEDQGRFSPMFIFFWQNYARSVSICKERDYQYQIYAVSNKAETDTSHSKSQKNHQSHSISPSKNLSKWVKENLKRLFFVLLIWYWVQFNKDKRFARKLLTQYEIACVLLISDRHVGIETALVRMANILGIPSLIVPFGFADEESSVVYRQAQENWRKTYGMQSSLNRVIAIAKPNWVYTHDGDPLLWNPPSWLFAALMAGILPQLPWALGGGGAWRMAVESQYHKDSFMKQGIPSQKLFVSGKARYDYSAQIWDRQITERAELCRLLSLDNDKRILVCSVPQMAEHDLLPWPEHWAEIDFLFSSLANLKSHANVLLSLHPRSDINQYLPKAEKYGLIISRDYTYEHLIPLCDVFVATYSSTVTLAMACQKPSIVIDFYNLGYDYFDNVYGIEVCRTHNEFTEVLMRVFSNQIFYDQLVEGQAKSSEYWARFDGKVTERILDTVNELVAKGGEIRKLPPRKRRQALPPWSQ
jgi:hypothetical protein